MVRKAYGDVKNSHPGKLRIVAGKWRNRRLKIAPIETLRPTPERIRETLFNWLAPNIQGCNCLDLFAGTGALGLEALSRGANFVTFVENSKLAAEFLRNSSSELGAKSSRIYIVDAINFLCKKNHDVFDVVFLDPPFFDISLEMLCELLFENNWLAPSAKVYLEQNSQDLLPSLPSGWTIKHQKVAGKVRYILVEAV